MRSSFHLSWYAFLEVVVRIGYESTELFPRTACRLRSRLRVRMTNWLSVIGIVTDELPYNTQLRSTRMKSHIRSMQLSNLPTNISIEIQPIRTWHILFIVHEEPNVPRHDPLIPTKSKRLYSIFNPSNCVIVSSNPFASASKSPSFRFSTPCSSSLTFSL